MKYYSFNDPIFENFTNRVISNTVRTFSEDDIIQEYWDYWYTRMCNKYGREYVDSNYCKKDCIEDWIVTNWAWECD